jgi:hypothetical protein
MALNLAQMKRDNLIMEGIDVLPSLACLKGEASAYTHGALLWYAVC